MSYNDFFSPEGTVLPALDDLVDVSIFDHDLIDDDILFYPRLYLNPLRQLVTSQRTVVHQEDVLLGRTDLQGICWRKGDVGKEAYRAFREKTHSIMNMYYPAPYPFEENRGDLDYTGNEFYRFRFTDTKLHCTYGHPQLRNLVCAPTKNDVYYLAEDSVQHWCPQLRSSKSILGRPHRGPHSRLPHRVTTMAAKDEHLLVGGDDGSFTYMNLETSAKPILGDFSETDYMEVNGMEISRSRTGGLHAFISVNGPQVRCVDLHSLATYASYPTNWFANYTSQSPDGHMIGIVGDHHQALVMSVNSREIIATLSGHKRHAFSVAWSPDSRMIATGSDDRSTCIYDTRNMDEPVHILAKDITDSVRSLRYSPCGRYLVMAEDRNYIHIVDTTSDYSKAQKIDFVGDVSGISLTPDGESLFVGVSKVDFSSILEFEKVNSSIDSFLDGVTMTFG